MPALVFLDIKQWCDHVTINPDDSRIIVFNRGTLNWLMVVTPIGGQIHSVSIEGVSLLWKNAQKKAEKKQISLVITRSIPSFSPF